MPHGANRSVRLQTHLYAVSEGTDRIGAYAIDQTTGALSFIDDVLAGGTGPAHVAVDRSGKFVLAANYGNGRIAVLPARADGGVGSAVANPLAGANAHMIISDAANKFVLVPCKGADYVASSQLDPTTGAHADPHATLPTTAGAGPRHLAFAPGGAFAYLISENLSTLTAFAYDATTGHLTELQTVSNRTGAVVRRLRRDRAVSHAGAGVRRFLTSANAPDHTAGCASNLASTCRQNAGTAASGASFATCASWSVVSWFSSSFASTSGS